MSGKNTLKRNLKLLVIVLTGHADVPMAVRAMKAGAVDFIEKPFNPQLLIERIQACLDAEAQAHARGQRRRDAEALLRSLSTREREELELVVTGKPSKVGADRITDEEREDRGRPAGSPGRVRPQAVALASASAQSSHAVSATTSAVSTVAPHQMRRPAGASR